VVAIEGSVITLSTISRYFIYLALAAWTLTCLGLLNLSWWWAKDNDDY
jgi:hypothetical protein